MVFIEKEVPVVLTFAAGAVGGKKLPEHFPGASTFLNLARGSGALRARDQLPSRPGHASRLAG
jgi:hypothetical protein